MGATAAKEGSMEEILASIRKIISSDSSKNKKAEAKQNVEPAVEQKAQASAVVEEKSVSSEQPIEPDAQDTKGQAISQSGAQTTANPSEKPNSALRSPAENSQPPTGALAAIAASVAAGEVKSLKADEASAPVETKATAAPIAESTPQQSLKSLAETVKDMDLHDKSPEPEKPKVDIAPEKASVEEAPIAEASEAKAFKEALVSPATQIAVTGSIDRLKKSVADNQSAHVEAALRPMLREWLDENLPNMVEKIVREEIDRIAKIDAA